MKRLAKFIVLLKLQIIKFFSTVRLKKTTTTTKMADFQVRLTDVKLYGASQNLDGFYALAQQLGFKTDGFPNFAAAIQSFLQALENSNGRSRIPDDFMAYITQLKIEFDGMDPHKGGLSPYMNLTFRFGKSV